MLDTATKRRIDTARDILVGKVPDPKSQVEQITIALIYKFMDDIDSISEELGGQRKYFSGDFARYGWPRLVRSGLGGHETLNLYAEAITRMPENPAIPPLFRDIFNNAYLPYRDPETLRAFLKIIDEFNYDHSERLGDAFEYLLSILGSQGDAGQFRTPRHIIDFMVAIIDPKKDETVLDPACGTAGFLISAYKHILEANRGSQGGQDNEGNPVSGLSRLTPDEKGKLATNFTGYDISPDMVRLSLVNLYLHGFVAPQIHEYDTLTSEERWNEYADVILANPPFMSPKGGIRPHSRFSVQSKRSEVLFVDYMAEHLTPGGRAGIIVPEGIIFQSQNAHRQLRKMLVEKYLVAVISLPAGVFKPYSGVKTSILVLDRALARRSNRIAFFKVENDGFDLGDQRRAIAKNDLPKVKAEITEYLRRLRAEEPVGGSEPAPTGQVSEPEADYTATLGLITGKEKIAEDGEYNLSGERYRRHESRLSKFLIVPLGEVAEVVAGQSPPGKSYNDTGIGMPFYQGKTEFKKMFIGKPTKWTTDPKRFAEEGDILMSVRAPVGPVNLTTSRICIGRGIAAIRPNENRMLTNYIFYILRSLESEIIGNAGAAFASINKDDIQQIKIPLPPLEIQREIVAEIEGYQRVIDGARAVIDNYQPHIVIDPEWPMVSLGDSQFFRVESGGTPKSSVGEYWNGSIPWATLVDLPPTDPVAKIRTTQRTISETGLAKSSAKLIPENSVIVSTRATIGRIGINRTPLATNQGFKNIIINNPLQAIPEYVALVMTKLVPIMNAWASGGTFKEISKSRFCKLEIPLPPLKTQQSIVAEIEAEQTLVAANRELIERFEKKIQSAVERVWNTDVSEKTKE